MTPLAILLTNGTLKHRAGSELYLRDVAIALLRRGHRPVAFSTVLGPIAEELRLATVPVVDDLDRLAGRPDVIHGQHHVETLVAALHFPETPIVNFCHGWLPWEEQPLRHPAVKRYVAVDDVCRDRLVRQEGIPEDRVEVLLNFVDLARFRPRPPLPAVPGRALVFSNEAVDDTYPAIIRQACEPRGIKVDVVGRRQGNEADAPELLLADYDLVFAKGRAALEALAVGCSVVLADVAGAGPLVTPENVASLRRLNFGVRTLQHEHAVDRYTARLDGYDADAAAVVRTEIRATADLERVVDRLEAIYDEVLHMPVSTEGASRAAARHLRSLAPVIKLTDGLHAETTVAVEGAVAMKHQLERVHAELAEANRSASATVRRAVARLPLVGPLLLWLTGRVR